MFHMLFKIGLAIKNYQNKEKGSNFFNKHTYSNKTCIYPECIRNKFTKLKIIIEIKYKNK